MDLGLSEEQELLKGFARDFLEKECPEALVREMEEDERGYKPEFWRMMAAQGWQGMIIPQQYGGTGMSFTDLIVLLEEFGRALVPGPFISTVVLGAMPILEAGTEEMQLCLRHLGLHPKQEAVVEIRRIVAAVLVDDQRAGQGTDLDQAVPIGVGPRQARGLQGEHGPHLSQGHLGHQPLEIVLPIRCQGAKDNRTERVLIEVVVFIGHGQIILAQKQV